MNPRTEELSDVLMGMRNGAEQSFEDFVRLYQPSLLRVTYRVLHDYGEAEDAVQETLFRACRRIDTYNESYRFTTWLYSIARNVAIDRLRQRKWTSSLDGEEKGMSYDTVHSRLTDANTMPFESMLQRERCEELCLAIMSLPHKYRDPLSLQVFGELSLKEVSERLDLPVGTIKTRIFRGRALLRQQLL